MKIALDQENYENCKDLKLCNDIVYELVNPGNPIQGGQKEEFKGDQNKKRIRKAFISFDGFIVQRWKDKISVSKVKMLLPNWKVLSFVPGMKNTTMLITYKISTYFMILTYIVQNYFVKQNTLLICVE